jgi:CO/xanthine dehydrogenase FAD-binding subunit
METPNNQVFFPVSYQELFGNWTRFPDAVPYAGGSSIISRQGNNLLTLPAVILCLDKLEELHSITRTEHHLEIGAMVTLNRLIRLGKIVPEILVTCLKNIAGVQLRNIATIGGNICCKGRLYDLSAALTALDAQYELRNANTTRWVSAARFHSNDETALEKQELLTRVRLPLHTWDYSIYKKFFPEDIYNSEALVFLARAQKSILTEIRVVYKTNTILRNKNSEDLLNGKFLPLNRKTALEFVENWNHFLSARADVSEFSKNALLNNIEENVFILSE